MSFTSRESWSLVHGILCGGLFLLAYSGGLIGFVNLRSGNLTPEGAVRQARLLGGWTLTMAILAWLAVIIGAYIIYPWYRAHPTGHSLSAFPQASLMANPDKAGWHNFGMEWKEHVAWFAPMLATCVAFIVSRYREKLADDPLVRRISMTLFTVAFLAATAAGLFGALITKAAPV